MDVDIIMGLLIISLALIFITYIVFWSRRTIDLIADKKLRSVREIIKELHNGR